MFRCRLLNLSACSGAMVNWLGRSDDYHGLMNGFLYAGARNILGSVWPVQDDCSAFFNRAFYEAVFRKDADGIAALRYALRQVRTHKVGKRRPFDHPLFWAGFRVVGFS
jgi:CHAT domain-containing protein